MHKIINVVKNNVEDDLRITNLDAFTYYNVS